MSVILKEINQESIKEKTNISVESNEGISKLEEPSDQKEDVKDDLLIGTDNNVITDEKVKAEEKILENEFLQSKHPVDYVKNMRNNVIQDE